MSSGFLIISKTGKNEINQVQLEKGICFSYLGPDGVGLTVMADEEYPARVACDLLYRGYQAFNEYIYENKIDVNSFDSDIDVKFPYLVEILSEWQDPTKSIFLSRRQSVQNTERARGSNENNEKEHEGFGDEGEGFGRLDEKKQGNIYHFIQLIQGR